jgi:hypothetical protein
LCRNISCWNSDSGDVIEDSYECKYIIQMALGRDVENEEDIVGSDSCLWVGGLMNILGERGFDKYRDALPPHLEIIAFSRR